MSVVAKVVDQGLLSVPESEFSRLGLRLGDEVALDIQRVTSPGGLPVREERERTLNATRGAWADIPDEFFDQIMNELAQGYNEWDRRLNAGLSGHGDSH